eukprot:g20304.t1
MEVGGRSGHAKPNERVVPAPPVEPPPLEEHEKNSITVYYKGERNVVTWYVGEMGKRDIQEAILCACDAIMDGGFVLREMVPAGTGSSNSNSKQNGGAIDDLLSLNLGQEDVEKPITGSTVASSGSSSSASRTPAPGGGGGGGGEQDEEEFSLGERVLEFEDFDKLEHGRTYLLQPGKERTELSNITGDRWRRIKVQIDPVLHVEAQKAIHRMKRGSNLLKHTRYGFPHLRMFQLSEDTRRLLWYSAAKSKEETAWRSCVLQLAAQFLDLQASGLPITVIAMDQIAEIRLGQTTASFQSYKLPMLEHLSFSVCTLQGGKTLDITCKDEFEFDHWVTGLKALHYHHTSRVLSKEELLNHSQRFKQALAKNNVSIKLTQLPEVKEKGHVALEDCIEITGSSNKDDLEKKIDRLKERHKSLQLSIMKVDFHAEAEMELDLAVQLGQGPAYAQLFTDAENCEDEEMEMKRMEELLKEVQSGLTRARNDWLAMKLDTDKSALRALDQHLWKLEVDLENVEDILARYLDNSRGVSQPWQVTLAENTAKIEKGFREGVQTLGEKMEEWKTWWKK